MQGYTYFSYFLLQNIDCGYSLEPSQRGDSNVYPQSMFIAWANFRNGYILDASIWMRKLLTLTKVLLNFKGGL